MTVKLELESAGVSNLSNDIQCGISQCNIPYIYTIYGVVYHIFHSMVYIYTIGMVRLSHLASPLTPPCPSFLCV